jgi:hypothetical protein
METPRIKAALKKLAPLAMGVGLALGAEACGDDADLVSQPAQNCAKVAAKTRADAVNACWNGAWIDTRQVECQTPTGQTGVTQKLDHECSTLQSTTSDKFKEWGDCSVVCK